MKLRYVFAASVVSFLVGILTVFAGTNWVYRSLRKRFV